MKKSELIEETVAPREKTTVKATATTPRATSAKNGSTTTDSKAVSEPEPQPSNGANQAESVEKTPSSILKAIGTEIVTTHAAVTGAFVEVLLSAAKCGLLFLAAKDVVKPGFEAWFEQMNFPFTKATRCKYMRLADRLCEEGKSKPGLLLSLQTETKGLHPSFTFDELRLRTIINAVSDGRSLSELYFDWDIVKKPLSTSNSQPASPQNSGENESSDEVVGRWSKVMKGLPFIFARLQPEVQTALLSDLEGLLAKLKSIQLAPASET
jgi:hypothetical protein